MDLGFELVGQATDLGTWGNGNEFGEDGDFNIFAIGGSGAPTGTHYFQITTAEGTGVPLQLVSFAPIPEPSTYAALAGILVLLLAGARRFHRKEK